MTLLGLRSALGMNGAPAPLADASTIPGLLHRMRPVNLGLADGALVGSVPSEVGGLTYTQTDVNSQPTFVASAGLGGRPCLRFDGANDTLTSTTNMTARAQPVTLVVVARQPTEIAQRQIVWNNAGIELLSDDDKPSLWAGSAEIISTIAISPTVATLVVGTFNGASSTIHVNDVLGVTGNPGGNGITANPLQIAAQGFGRYFPGDIHELLIYDHALTAGERATLNTYVTGTYNTAPTAIAKTGAAAAGTAAAGPKVRTTAATYTKAGTAAAGTAAAGPKVRTTAATTVKTGAGAAGTAAAGPKVRTSAAGYTKAGTGAARAAAAGAKLAGLPIATLVDDFTTARGDLWGASDASIAQAAAGGGRVTIPAGDPAVGNTYLSLWSRARYSLADSAVYAEVVAPATSAAISYETIIQLASADQSVRIEWLFSYTGDFRPRYFVGGNPVYPVGWTPYDPAATRYLRISEDAGVVTWSVSADAQTWTTTLAVDLAAVYPAGWQTGLALSLLAGHWQVESLTGQPAVFGGVNTVGGAATQPAAVTGRATGANDAPTALHTVPMPADTQIGESLLVVFSNDIASVVASTTSTGWQVLATDAQGTTTNHRGTVFYKPAATGADTLLVQLTAAEEATWAVLRVAAGGTPTVASANGSGGTTLAMPAVTPPQGTATYLAVLAVCADSSTTTAQAITWPGGYGNTQARNPTVTSSAATFTAEASLTGVATINPGTATMGAAEQWVAFTIAFPPGTPPVGGTGAAPATILGAVTGAGNTPAAAHTVTPPAGTAPGEMLVVAFSNDNATCTASTTSPGWEVAATMAQGTTTNHRGTIFVKRAATGSDTLTVDLSEVQEATWVAQRVGAAGAGALTVASANGSGGPYNPAAVTPAAGAADYLAILAVHTDSSTTTAQVVTWPAGYVNAQAVNPSITSSAATFTAAQNYSGLATIDPGAFSLSAVEQWVAHTLAIPGTSVTQLVKAGKGVGGAAAAGPKTVQSGGTVTFVKAGTAAAGAAAAGPSARVGPPRVLARATGGTPGNALTHPITLPAGVVPGNVLVVLFSVDSNKLLSTTDTEWEFHGYVSQGANCSSALFSKVATGNDALTLTTSQSEESTHISLRCDLASAVRVRVASNSASFDPDPPPITMVAAGSYLSIVAMAVDASVDAANPITAPPGYQNLTVQNAATTTGALSATAELGFTGTAQDPGLWVHGTSEQWVCWHAVLVPTGGNPAMVIPETGAAAPGATAAGVAVVAAAGTRTKTGGAAAAGAATGTRVTTAAAVRVKAGAGAAAGAAAGAKQVLTAAAVVKTGTGAAGAAAAGAKVRAVAATYTKTGTAAAGTAAAGARATTYTKTGAAAEGTAAAGAKVHAAAATYTKTGVAAATTGAAGGKVRTTAAVITKTGAAAAATTAAGAKARTSAATYTKTGAAATTTAATGASARTTAAVVTKTGTGAAAGAGTGARTTTSAQVRAKTGTGAATMAATGTRLRTSAATLVKTGGAAAGTAAAGADVLTPAPARVLNIGGGAAQTHFKLQYAIPGGTTQQEADLAVLAGGFSLPPYFFTSGAGDRVRFYARLDAPKSSAQAGGSRCELREVDAAGQEAAWDAMTGEHELYVRTAATHLPPVNPAVVLAQLHDGTNDRISVRTQLLSGVPKLIFRINGSSVGLPRLDEAYAAGRVFSVRLRVTEGGVVSIYYNDAATPIYTGGQLVSTGGPTWYWKAGLYNQSTTDDPTEGGEAEVQALAVAHAARVPLTYAKAGAGTATAAAAGARVTAAAATRVKTGGAAAAAVATGTKTVTSGWRYAGTAAALAGPWANVPGAAADTVGDPATWTATGAGTAVLELAGFGLEQVVPAGAAVQSLAVRVRTAADPGLISVLTAQCYVGATPVGAPQPLLRRSDAHEDVVTVPAVAYEDLPALRVRITATRPDAPLAAGFGRTPFGTGPFGR